MVGIDESRGTGDKFSARTMLLGVAAPSMMSILNMQMIRVALPAIRSDLGLRTDTASWIVNIYTLSHLILMPLYGRLGDELGRRRVFLFGVIIFLVGTSISLVAMGLPLLLIGRAIQGIGAGCIVPLSIAMISGAFPASEQGKALGIWNSLSPIGGVTGTLLAGVVIDTWGWSTIFVPVLAVGSLAVLAFRRLVPPESREMGVRFLPTFDWGGAALLGAGLTLSLLYISSESITGVPPLQDWRLLAGSLVLLGAFAILEMRQPNPYITLSIFGRRDFTLASLCAAVRMFTMSGVMFVMPLYLVDVRGLGAASASLILVSFDGCLFLGMWLGGHLVDRWGSRWPLVLSMGIQVATIACFAILSDAAAVALVAAGLAAHGIGAGVAQPALHRAAMEASPLRERGTAAGLYSMIRFCGRLLGSAAVGVVIQRGLDSGLQPTSAYPVGFWFIAMVGSLGSLMGLALHV